MSDLELLSHFRARVGNEVVNEQIAAFGADSVLTSMRRAHQAHLSALALTPTELHQRAELMESLMLELDVPPLGAGEDLTTDAQRVQLFIEVVRGLVDRVIEHDMAQEMAAGLTAAEVEREHQLAAETAAEIEADALREETEHGSAAMRVEIDRQAPAQTRD